MSVVFIVVGIGVVAVVIDAIINTKKTQNALRKVSGLKSRTPKAISMMLMLAQVSELSRAFQNTEHVSIVALIAALIIFTIWGATKSGIEEI